MKRHPLIALSAAVVAVSASVAMFAIPVSSETLDIPVSSKTTAVTVDTFVASTILPNFVFTGRGQWDNVLRTFVDNVGFADASNPWEAWWSGKYSGTFRSLQQFDFAEYTGKTIVSATWHADVLATRGTTPVVVWLQPNDQAWDPWTVTYENQPTVRSDIRYATGITGAGGITADVTDYVRNYASGTWTNDGFSVRGPANGFAQLASYIYGPASYVTVTYRDGPPCAKPPARTPATGACHGNWPRPR